MNCHEIRSMADAYVDRELKGLEHGRVENHVRQCPACQQWVRMVQRTRDTVRTKLDRGRAPDRLTERIRATLNDAPRGTFETKG
ncbi:MAG: zf-HC2 domain-containing protein [Planctomycetia bacterium]|nr:zf-HC2 domain-containing protein [Planctomycetia bacterium]